MCSPFMYISQLLCFHLHHVYPQPHPLTPIAPPFSLTNAIPIDPYMTLVFVWYLHVRISTLIPVIDYSTCLDSPMKPSVPNFRKPSSLQRYSFILDFYTPLSLDYTPVLNYFWTSRPLPTLLESLESLELTWNTWTRIQGGHSAWAEANIQTPLVSGWVVQCTIQHLDNLIHHPVLRWNFLEYSSDSLMSNFLQILEMLLSHSLFPHVYKEAVLPQRKDSSRIYSQLSLTQQGLKLDSLDYNIRISHQ